MGTWAFFIFLVGYTLVLAVIFVYIAANIGLVKHFMTKARSEFNFILHFIFPVARASFFSTPSTPPSGRFRRRTTIRRWSRPVGLASASRSFSYDEGERQGGLAHEGRRGHRRARGDGVRETVL
jgi:hypothetical protein